MAYPPPGYPRVPAEGERPPTPPQPQSVFGAAGGGEEGRVRAGTSPFRTAAADEAPPRPDAAAPAGAFSGQQSAAEPAGFPYPSAHSYPPLPKPSGGVGSGAVSGAAFPAGPESYPAVPAAGGGGGGVVSPFTYPPGGGQTWPGGGEVPTQPPPAPQPFQQQPVLGVPAGLQEGWQKLQTHPVWGPDQGTREARFGWVGWALFVLGFFFPWLWLMALLLPCCLPGRGVRLAASASLVAGIIYAALGLVLGPTMRMRHQRGW
ncbi:hypothetical protein HYH03_017616 [Edaphochlamys debaryana]|uniref:Uncharacterized protein n=1 Tax=Edaphochlamys debaryana TaxID=47281 RepID=A0A836BNP9_9CHLO|nr:hypothetical protein HYH03_017616 [Edaphochlamys debaryana]|eukprot:KAG2483506.1 hypothetical protein HYH03_017616 [Edaphochlamys debaryana]